jgi:hypothetical protein
VSLTAACLGLALAGFSPFGVKDVDGIELSLHLTATGILVAAGVLALICVLKGKYRTVLFGLFLPPIEVISALRLARRSDTQPLAAATSYRNRGMLPHRSSSSAEYLDPIPHYLRNRSDRQNAGSCWLLLIYGSSSS